MDKQRNLQEIKHSGDLMQYRLGNQASSYAKKINQEELKQFCEDFNNKVELMGFSISTKDGTINSVELSMGTSFTVPVRLLDHNIAIEANEKQWKSIGDRIYQILKDSWINCLKSVKGYTDHMKALEDNKKLYELHHRGINL